MVGGSEATALIDVVTCSRHAASRKSLSLESAARKTDFKIFKLRSRNFTRNFENEPAIRCEEGGSGEANASLDLLDGYIWNRAIITLRSMNVLI